MSPQRKQKLVVIGNGMVGYKFCEMLTDSRGGEAFEITVLAEEKYPAYDRVHLTDYFGGSSADDLLLAPTSWYKQQGIRLHLGDPVASIDRAKHTLRTAKGKDIQWDRLVFATGSRPFVPPMPGAALPGVFVYRTLDDLEAITRFARGRVRAAVMGGGLLGLEAAKALYDLGLEAHVVEYNNRLMGRQLDDTGAGLLRREVESLGVRVHTGKATRAVERRDNGLRLAFGEGEPLDVDMVVVSAGIRPRDELATACGIDVHERGGIVVNDALQTSDPDVYAIGECALHRGTIYGLVAPCYQMADVAVRNLLGEKKAFQGADMSTQLKLMGVEVATVGESVLHPDADMQHVTYVTIQDDLTGVYKRLLIDKGKNTLIGAILVGSSDDYGRLVQAYRSGEVLPERPLTLMVQPGGDPVVAGGGALVCTCNNVTADGICAAVEGGLSTVPDVCKATQAGTGCGGCKPMVATLVEQTLKRLGHDVKKQICEHFSYSRKELYEVVEIKHLSTFDEVLDAVGSGGGCEVCKPLVASIMASTTGQTAAAHPVIQDTNDRFLANIQRGGTYSIVPRVPGGEITPQQLVVLGTIAGEYDLYTKITGGQRIDLFGAKVDDLPEIWEKLIAAGFESGHAYAKGLRTVKSCVGSTWCRFGLLDSVGFAIRVENRYKGLRSPHKLKSAVSGCIRECAEARSKDFGIIATEDGWNLYVGGNGGANPRHAELLASGIDDETCIRYIDRFLMYYIHTADPLTRTAPWIEQLDGGLEYLRQVVVDDHLGIAAQLEAEMQALVDGYECEWKQVVEDPEKRRRFRAFANREGADSGIRFASERQQKRSASGGAPVEVL